MKFTICILLACLVWFVPSAQSSMIVTYPAVSANLTDYTWSYAVALSPGFRVTRDATPCPLAPSGGICQALVTIYDFAGYVPGSEFAPTGWTFVGALTGPTPIGITSGTLVDGVDDPTLFNLAWRYDGATAISATTPFTFVQLGQFGARSIYGDLRDTEYAVRNVQINPTTGTLVGRAINSAITGAPFEVPVPEPAYAAGVGGVLLLLGFLRRRKRSSSRGE